MKQMVKMTRCRALAIAALMAAGMLATALPSSAAMPPIGRTYFVVSLGLGADRAGAYQMGAGCLSFSRHQLCDAGGECGEWWLIEEDEGASRQWPVGFALSIVDDETGVPVEILGIGRIDSRGPRSSFAAAAHGIDPSSGAKINFAVAGRAVGARRCEQLVAEFEAARR